MWALSEYVERRQRELWKETFGTEFDPRVMRLVWGERVVGHICRGDQWPGGHTECIRMTTPAWV